MHQALNRSLHIYRAVLIVSNCHMLQNQQEKKALIMHSDVISCVIFMSDRVEYLKKEESYRNSNKDVILVF